MNFAEYPCRTISLDDRAAVDGIRQRAGHHLSSHAFIPIYLWQHAMGLSLCLQRDAFFVRIQSRGENAWMFPCGAADESIAFLRAGAKLPDFSLYCIREEDLAFLGRHLPGLFSFSETRGDAEYMYLRTNQLELSGGSYKNLRVKVRRAQERHSWQVCPLNDDTMAEAGVVMHGWQEQRSTAGDLEVGLLALEQYTHLGMQGILLRNQDGPQAVAMGSVIAPGVFDLHFTKTLLPGLDAYLRWAFFGQLSEDIVWIDQEDDLDLPGLRTHKLESKPDKLIPLWKGVPRL